MARILPKAFLILTLGSSLFIGQINAYCSRCVRIEEERAKEQAKNPQTVGYYDDNPLSLKANKEDLSKQTPSHSSTSTKNAKRDSEESFQNPSKQNMDSKGSSEDPSSPSMSQDRLTDSQFDHFNQNQFLAAVDIQQNKPSQHTGPNNPSSPPDLPFKSEFFEEDEASKLDKSNLPSEEDREPLRKTYFEGSNLPPVASESNYSTILTILKTKYFLETLDGSFTLFVPSNEALRNLPPGTLFDLMKPENQEKLALLISNHAIARKILKKDFETEQNREIKAISGRNLTIRSDKGKLSVDGAQILRIEPGGYDGVIYVIDKVLFP